MNKSDSDLNVSSIRLLTTKQYKLNKGLSKGISTFGIQLAPANEAGHGTICAMAGVCVLGCIAKTGMNAFPTHASARVRRTTLLKTQPPVFFGKLYAEIDSWVKSQTAQGYKLAARPNTLSDLPLLAMDIARRYPQISVYDYTKLPRPADRRLPNYHITYSFSERTTAADLQHCLDHKVNIAVILNVKKGVRLPKTVQLQGITFPVIDGDVTDLRFKDKSDRCYVVGLRWKHSKDSAAKLAGAIAAGLVIDPTAPRALAEICIPGNLSTSGASYRATLARKAGR